MQNAENKEDIIVSKPVLEVFAIASEYCLFIDKMANYEQVEAFSFLQKILSALYLKGCLFPTIEVEDDTANERFVTEEEYETLRLKLSQYMGDKDYYSTVDLSQENIDSTPVTLSELLSDIYLDLKDFLLLYAKDQQSAKENAIASCHYYFMTNWGMKITLILPYLHHLLFAPTTDEDD
ncbi:MAG TPA: DUF5063 domain-containing protein [Bacteroidales bacterium]|jgi:hypothetical protein|nr:DUF5063 domain-containing protein [Bacteroidales bacterium]HNW67855.1 DUF5063 domain-containing protein [Bacteroidales bacterium]HPT51893.1 DUF5063 domain-containing protein [Bacteroidales bacterium]